MRRKRSSPVASNCRIAAPNWKPCVHSVQPRLVYSPFTVNTGVPALGSQRFSRRSILAADASKSRVMAGCRVAGVSSWSISIIGLEPLQMHATVDVEHVAGRKREGPLEQAEHRLANVVAGPPAFLRYQALGDELVVL